MTTVLLFSIFVFSLIISAILTISIFYIIRRQNELKREANEKIQQLMINNNIEIDIKLRESFLSELKEIVSNELNKKIIVDKMANNYTISSEEMLNEIDNIIDKFYATYPVKFMNIMLDIYTKEQIKLLITDEVINFSRSYYRIFDTEGRK